MSISTVDLNYSESDSISAVHSDIIGSHILTRLDGQTLISASMASSELFRLSKDQSLWSNLCSSTWPSTNSPRVREAISSFPGGHRSFFSDCFSILRNEDGEKALLDRPIRKDPTVLISAVDLRYRGRVILSRIVETETDSDWFDHSPFLIDLVLHRKGSSSATEVRFSDERDEIDEIEIAESLELSWIVILAGDSSLAGNISSFRPVSVHRNSVSGDFHAKFAAVISAGESPFSPENFLFGVSITCGGSHGGTVHVSEACLSAEDVDGNHLSGRDSLVILRRALRGKRVNSHSNSSGGKRRYEEFLERKREKKERQVRKESVLDLVSASLFGGLAFLFVSWVIIRSYH